MRLQKHEGIILSSTEVKAQSTQHNTTKKAVTVGHLQYKRGNLKAEMLKLRIFLKTLFLYSKVIEQFFLHTKIMLTFCLSCGYTIKTTEINGCNNPHFVTNAVD